MHDNQCLGLTLVKPITEALQMRMNRRKVQVLGAVGFLFLAVSVAQADTFSAWNVSTNPPTDAISWANIVGCGVGSINPTCTGANSYSFAITNGLTDTSTHGNVATLNFGVGSGAIFILGTNWAGGDTASWDASANPPYNVISGSSLLSTNDTANNSGSTEYAADNIQLSFGTNLSAFGVVLQSDQNTTSFTASLTYFTATSGEGCLAGCTITASSTGAPVFIGVLDGTAADITNVTLDETSSNNNSHFFAVGPASLIEGTVSSPSVPEPGTMLLLAGGLAVIGWKARKRVRG